MIEMETVSYSENKEAELFTTTYMNNRIIEAANVI